MQAPDDPDNTWTEDKAAADFADEEDADKDRDKGDADDEYIPDPDAPPTTEGRVEQAVYEMQKLLLSSLQATGLVGAFLLVIDFVRGVGFSLTKGFVLGALMATLNLWLLASGILSLSRGQAATTRGILTLGASFFALAVCSFWVVFYARALTLGFAVGLAIPAAGGLLYARVIDRPRPE